MADTDKREGQRFCIRFDYTRGQANPAQFFQAHAAMITALLDLEAMLLQSFGDSVHSGFFLDSVDPGSLKTWIISVLEAADDADLKKLEWKGLIGTYLVKGKHAILHFLNGHTQVSSRQQLRPLEKELHALAQATGVKQLPAYDPVRPDRLLGTMAQLSEAARLAPENTNVTILDAEFEEMVSTGFRAGPADIQTTLANETIENRSTMILKIRKPDFLGPAQWEFLHDKSCLRAKIVDDDWLEKFHARSVVVRPGDSLRATVHYVTTYDAHGDVLSSQTEVEKVEEVIEASVWVQEHLFDNEEK